MDGRRLFASSSRGFGSVDNPFVRHHKPLGDVTLDPLLLQAPLPLQAWSGQRDVLGLGVGIRLFSLGLADLRLISLTAPAAEQLSIETALLSLLYVTSGEVSLFVDDVRWTARAGSCLLVPGGSLRWRSSACSLVCLMLDWPTVSDRLKGWLTHGMELSAALAGRGRPQLVDCIDTELMASVLASLDRDLRLLSQLLSVNPSLLVRLGLAQQLTTLVLLLAFPELSRPDGISSDKAPVLGLGTVLDDLIDYIKSHLDEPLSLSQLEHRSHYSRRTLQYAFRDRFGCTPTQWIRAQRLDLAYKLLSHPDREASVASIAKTCGYRSMSLFSIEFQQRFHCKPSRLLRESRAMAPDPPP